MADENPVTFRRERFKGCLIGQCLGDALGFPVEGYPGDICQGYVRTALYEKNIGTIGKGRFPFGQYTDDSQLTRELMRSLASYQDCSPHDEYYHDVVLKEAPNLAVYRGFVPGDFGRRMAVLFKEKKVVGRGHATEAACLRLADGIPWQQAGEPAPNAGNGSAMRAAPIGLFFWNSADAIKTASLDQSRITHRDLRCGAGAIAIAGAVALNLRKTDLPGDFTRILAGWVQEYDPILADGIQSLAEWCSLRPDAAYKKIACQGMDENHSRHAQLAWKGITPFVTESVLWSLYAFLSSPANYLNTIRTAIAVGGDVDTTAAMAGAISGSYLGFGGLDLPVGLAEKLTDCGTWGYDELLQLAEQTCAAREARYDHFDQGGYMMGSFGREMVDGGPFNFTGGGKAVSLLDLKEQIYRPPIDIEQGDLLTAQVEAIVNPANTQSFLGLGSHISAAIRKRGGKKLIQQRQQIGTIARGDAVITTGGDLPFRYVIHAAILNMFDFNPLFLLKLRQRTSDEVLRRAIKNALNLALKNKIRSLAFSPMGAGIGAMPMQKCATIMLQTVYDFFGQDPDTFMERIVFVAHKEQDVRIFNEAYTKIFTF